ncbi:biotin transporter BioY [Alkalicella caledoniensis]|uniref:Biotin transporter n=1 Tax=Alkalicella caledoniensis TaxID=2731377 RepID=A0A7G9W6Y5_ALKCA|nr:biotin transporter BioY [Alkalicella caledoniensis]QNO14447.1 biotin transporter BioY [Alkalicella caledoniensis]
MSPSVIRTQALVKISLFAVLTYIGSLIQIPMYPTPVTLQTFFVMLSGMFLGPVYGAISQIVYMFMGLVGLPVFSGGGGIGYVLHPSFGFILGFIILAFFCGLGKGKFDLLWIIAGNIVLYLVGTTYIWYIVNNVMGSSVTLLNTIKGMVIFLPGDIVKMIVAVGLVRKVSRNLRSNPKQ